MDRVAESPAGKLPEQSGALLKEGGGEKAMENIRACPGMALLRRTLRRTTGAVDATESYETVDRSGVGLLVTLG